MGRWVGKRIRYLAVGGSPDPVERGDASFAGPRTRPRTPPPAVTRSDYKIETVRERKRMFQVP